MHYICDFLSPGDDITRWGLDKAYPLDTFRGILCSTMQVYYSEVAVVTYRRELIPTGDCLSVKWHI